MKRLGILAVYDRDGRVDEAEENLIKSFTPVFDRYIVVVNGNMEETACAVLKQYADEVIFRENEGFDGGAYQDKMLGMEDVLFWIECSKVAAMSSVDEFVSLHRDHTGRESVKVMGDGGEQRARLWAKIHDYSLRRSGFELTDEETDIFHRFSVERVAMLPRGSRDELEAYYEVLKKTRCKLKRCSLRTQRKYGSPAGNSFRARWSIHICGNEKDRRKLAPTAKQTYNTTM